MILEILLKADSAVNILAALIPSILFLGLLLYFVVIVPNKVPKPKIVDIKDEFFIIGVMTKTTKETFFEDDLLLWKEYKRVKEKKMIDNKKEAHSFVAIRLKSKEEDKFDYLIGDIVEKTTIPPVGLKRIIVPPAKYASFPISIKDEHSWAPAITKIEKHVYEKWLPNSEYELDTDAPVRELEYHDKRSAETTHTMKFYVAIRPKK